MAYLLIRKLEGKLLRDVRRRAETNRRSVVDEIRALLARGLKASEIEESAPVKAISHRHPEVRAKRASKDDGPSPFEALARKSVITDLRIKLPISGKPEIGARAPQGDGESQKQTSTIVIQ